MNLCRRDLVLLLGVSTGTVLTGCLGGGDDSRLVYVGSLGPTGISVTVTLSAADSGEPVIDETVTIESSEPSDSTYVSGTIEYGREYRVDVSVRKDGTLLHNRAETMAIYESQTLSVLIDSERIDISKGEE